MLRAGFLCVDPCFRGFSQRDFFVVEQREFRVRAVFRAFDACDFKVERGDYDGFDFVRHVRVLAAGLPRSVVEVSMSAVKSKPGPLDLVRHAFAYDGADYDPGIDCTGYVDEDGVLHETPSLTRQSDSEDCDINVMMARYQATGVEPRANPRAPQWGDFSSVLGFQEALNIVRQSEADFALLPAEVRDRFGNDPAGLLRFLEDENNRDEAIKLGIVMPPAPEEPPMRVEVVNAGGTGAEPLSEPKA